jgi:hypothetical protein
MWNRSEAGHDRWMEVCVWGLERTTQKLLKKKERVRERWDYGVRPAPLIERFPHRAP